MYLSDDLGAMRSDLTKVRQILCNLLSNACKFTDGGTVSITAERVHQDGRDWICFQVADTGIGITSQQQDNLFKEFAQADTSISRKYGGTGLGLAITYRFIHLMKGRISVESESGHGSTFTVYLPAELTPDLDVIHAGGEQPDRVSMQPVSDDTVLVIDDDPAVRDLMSRFLSRLGVNVVSASTAEEGVRLARQFRPLLITLDVVLPDSDGWTVLQTVKGDPELESIPVIMLTMVDNQAMAANLGASGYFVKPVDRERLTDLVERHRANKSASRKKRATESTSFEQTTADKLSVEV
jgi:CheY-like chemotaxis protein